MILLDTHIWAWLVDGDFNKLSQNQIKFINNGETKGLTVSIISVWEIAKKVELKKWNLSLPLDIWIEKALQYPNITLSELNINIVKKSTQLPGNFHKDPMDQIIVGTAIVNQYTLVTSDSRIIDYPHVKTIS